MLFPVRWFNCLDTNRLHGVFPFCWWPDRPSIAQCSGSYPDLSPKSIIPATSIPSLFIYHPSSAYSTDIMPLHMPTAFYSDYYL